MAETPKGKAMRVKVFYDYPNDAAWQINTWLSENPKIVPKKLDGAERGSRSAIYVWYETRKTLPEKMMSVMVIYGYPVEHESKINFWLRNNPRVVIKNSVAMSRSSEVAVFILYTAPR